jgi:hypothetical protein
VRIVKVKPPAQNESYGVTMTVQNFRLSALPDERALSPVQIIQLNAGNPAGAQPKVHHAPRRRIAALAMAD